MILKAFLFFAVSIEDFVNGIFQSQTLDIYDKKVISNHCSVHVVNSLHRPIILCYESIFSYCSVCVRNRQKNGIMQVNMRCIELAVSALNAYVK